MLVVLATTEHFHNLVLKQCTVVWEHVFVGCVVYLPALEMAVVSSEFDYCTMVLVPAGRFVFVERLDIFAFVVYTRVVGDLVDHNFVEGLLVARSLAFLVVHNFASVLWERHSFASVV